MIFGFLLSNVVCWECLNPGISRDILKFQNVSSIENEAGFSDYLDLADVSKYQKET